MVYTRPFPRELLIFIKVWFKPVILHINNRPLDNVIVKESAIVIQCEIWQKPFDIYIEAISEVDGRKIMLLGGMLKGIECESFEKLSRTALYKAIT